MQILIFFYLCYLRLQCHGGGPFLWSWESPAWWLGWWASLLRLGYLGLRAPPALWGDVMGWEELCLWACHTVAWFCMAAGITGELRCILLLLWGPITFRGGSQIPKCCCGCFASYPPLDSGVGLHINFSTTTTFGWAVGLAATAREWHPRVPSWSFPLSCLPWEFKYSYLQMHWCVNLLGILVCWAEKPLLCYWCMANYWCMASCRFMGRYYELFQSAMMLMPPSIFDCLKKSLFLLHLWRIVSLDIEF